jgi:hypothetical protein
MIDIRIAPSVVGDGWTITSVVVPTNEDATALGIQHDKQQSTAIAWSHLRKRRRRQLGRAIRRTVKGHDGARIRECWERRIGISRRPKTSFPDESETMISISSLSSRPWSYSLLPPDVIFAVQCCQRLFNSISLWTSW